MSIVMMVLYFIVVLTVIVFVHEYGHFCVAKKFGVKIEEFAIGMGKRIFSFKDKSGVLWKFCLFPIGGYVKMYGDDNPSSFGGYSDNPTEDELKYALIYKHPLKKTAVAFAGPFMNFVLGVLLFFAVFNFSGKPVLKPIITEVLKDSYAEKAGIVKGDKIISINGHEISTFNDIHFQLIYSGYKNMDIEILRNGKKMSLLARYDKGKVFGIRGGDVEHIKMSPSKAIKESFYITYDITKKTIQAIANIILHQRGLENISGPIRIAKESAKAGNSGFWAFMYFIALISVSLGAINMLPIPSLDGGHVAVNLIEFITRRKFSNFAYKIFVIVGMACISLLIVIGFVNDLFLSK